jgi:sulfate transport system ATP-binding protein
MALARALAVQPAVMLLDEPFGALDARVRKELRDWLRRLHDDVHVTTVLVTHDQEEAMEVADRVVVMDHGYVQQVGSPRELYEQPANAFVMSFVGPVNHLDGAFVRPHDVAIHPFPVPATRGLREATVERLTHLGFEVRVELKLADGARLWSQITRDDLERMELAPRQRVYVEPLHARPFDTPERVRASIGAAHG